MSLTQHSSMPNNYSKSPVQMLFQDCCNGLLLKKRHGLLSDFWQHIWFSMSCIKSNSCWLHGACNMQHIKIWLLMDDHSGCVYFESMKVSWRIQRLKWREASPQCIHRFTVNHTEENIRENEEINRHRTPKAIVKHC